MRRIVAIAVVLAAVGLGIGLAAQTGDAARPAGTDAPLVVSLTGSLADGLSLPAASPSGPSETTVDLDTQGFARLHIGFRSPISSPDITALVRPYMPDGQVDMAPFLSDGPGSAGPNIAGVSWRGQDYSLRGVARVQIAFRNNSESSVPVTAYYIISRGN